MVLKRFFAVDEAQAFGVELGARFPTAHQSLGSGHTDYGIDAIYSVDLAGNWHVDANVIATHLGGQAPGQSPWQAVGAVALSRSFGEQWSWVAELSATRQAGAPSTGQLLLAPTYTITPAIAIDVGASVGLNPASGRWAVFAGMTFLAFKLF